jgi:spore coat polysaccharide biosynthesis protein SpsF (cytidylyltransferase family)
MKIGLITQARIGSTRFKRKILSKVSNKSTILDCHLHRVRRSKLVTDFIIATTNEIGIDIVNKISLKHGFNHFIYEGDCNDVLSRYYESCKELYFDYVVRVTSDCPLLDATLIDKIIEFTIEHNLDYCSNTLEDYFPDGQDVEVFKFNELEKAYLCAERPSEREHVTPYIKANSLRIKNYNDSSVKRLKKVRMTIDYEEDLMPIINCIDEFGMDASWRDYAEFIRINGFKNQKIQRNIGYEKSLRDEK